jgi:hypothetical protein
MSQFLDVAQLLIPSYLTFIIKLNLLSYLRYYFIITEF